MPKFTVILTETLTHRLIVEAATEMQAVEAAETFLTATDHDDRWLFTASGYEVSHAEPAPEDAATDVIAEGGA